MLSGRVAIVTGAGRADSHARPLATYVVGQVVGQMNVAMSARDVSARWSRSASTPWSG